MPESIDTAEEDEAALKNDENNAVTQRNVNKKKVKHTF